MSNNNNSKCQLFQLHIDAYLDDELEPARLAELKAHLSSCETCNAELAYAERLHRAVVDLPILNCSDQALEPIDRLFANNQTSSASQSTILGQRLGTFVSSLPGIVRYGVPSTAVVLLAIGLSSSYLTEQSGIELASQGVEEVAPEPQYTQTEIVQALQDLEIAIDYLGQISQRTNVMIEDRFLLRQLEDSINATFRDEDVKPAENDASNGPI